MFLTGDTISKTSKEVAISAGHRRPMGGARSLLWQTEDGKQWVSKLSLNAIKASGLSKYSSAFRGICQFPKFAAALTSVYFGPNDFSTYIG